MINKMPGYWCAYRNCSSKSNEGSSFFRFPKDCARGVFKSYKCFSAKIWLVSCIREDLLEKDVSDLHKNYKLCEKHFEDRFIRKKGSGKILLPNSIPTIFPHLKQQPGEANLPGQLPQKIIPVAGCSSGYSQSLESIPPLHWTVEKNSICDIKNRTQTQILSNTLSKVTCCVEECANKEQGPNFYKFPQSPLLANLWKSTLKIYTKHDFSWLSVCGEHFDERDFIPRTKMLKKMAIPSVQRNDEKQKVIMEKSAASCNCKCTCGKRESHPPSTSSQMEHANAETIESHFRPAPRNNGLVHKLNEFEVPEIKENTIIVCDANARIIINTGVPSLRTKLIKQVQNVLVENIIKDVSKNPGGNSSTVSTTKNNLEVNSHGNNEEEEDVICITDLQENVTENTEEKSIVSTTKLGSKPDLHVRCTNDSKEGMNGIIKDVSDLKMPDSLKRNYEELARAGGPSCPYCGFTVRRPKDLIRHVKRIHYGLFPKGSISDDVIYEELINHLEIQQKEDEEFPINYLNSNFTMFCQYCDQIFLHITSLTVHVKNVHETFCGPLPLSADQLMSGMRNCKYCNKALSNTKEYNTHIEECTSNPFYKGESKQHQVCEFCGLIGRKGNMKAHLSKAHGVGDEDKANMKFICEKCGSILLNFAIYKKHMLRHENIKGNRCPIEGCNKVFNTPNSLHQHKMIRHVPPAKWKFVCKKCGKRFPIRGNLLRHMQVHSTVRCRCGICGRTFQDTSNLRAHVSRKHSLDQKKAWVAPKVDTKLENAWKRTKPGKGEKSGIRKYKGDRELKEFESESVEILVPAEEILLELSATESVCFSDMSEEVIEDFSEGEMN